MHFRVEEASRCESSGGVGMKDAELADELEQRVEQVVDGEFELGLMIRVDSELPRIIAALRRPQPSSDQVLVPRELTPAMHEAGLRFAGTLHANYEDCWKALLAAAEAERRKT